MKNRPKFKKQRKQLAFDSPEELFSKLPNREQSHGYLRAPQVDALRDYMKIQKENDIALELPTGTGKTAVGLLIAEWRRRKSSGKVAFLTLTNQLAGQVLLESEKLGIDAADLRGTKDTRDQAEVGKYRAGQSIAVTTYSNLFNVNPVIQDSELIIFDDSHGGEHYASDMWAVEINTDDHGDEYEELINLIRPCLSDSQYRTISDELEYGVVEICDINGIKEASSGLIEIIDSINDRSVHFPWSAIRNNLLSCIFFISISKIVIRPIIPPTHTHLPFINTKQRIYMSATLGGEGDIIRSYGITNICSIHAQHAQWGKRYIFTPGLYLEEDECDQFISEVWNNLSDRRALLLAPSFNSVNRVFENISEKMDPKPIQLGSNDIEESLDVFVGNKNTILCLAGRYDGLDLPGDDCRLLIIAESPGAVGALERHQKEHWKLGPLLRRRERTRLIQGMGRCTRDATDFSVIILLGQSLTNSITTPIVAQGLPGEIQREIRWGITQGEIAKEDKKSLAEMVVGLLCDSNYRKEANENLEGDAIPEVISDVESFNESAKFEVKYSRTLWDGNYSKAYEIARNSADNITDSELSGYRAWWFYLASIAAYLQEEKDQEIDCLKRARAIGVNSGYLDFLLRRRNETPALKDVNTSLNSQAEGIWNLLEKWGWHGPKFGNNIKEMLDGLAALSEPGKYHIGLELLGKCLGAETIRTTDDGDPDVIWIFPNQAFTFEAKSDKKLDATISKKDIQQAKGHLDWLREKREDCKDISIVSVLVSPIKTIHKAGIPHAKDLSYISTDEVLEMAKEISSNIKNIRTEFSGKEYGTVLNELKHKIKQEKMDLDSFIDKFTSPILED